jgi:hypothetical protein
MPFRSSGRGAYGPQGQRVLKGPLAPVWTTFSPPAITSAAAYSYQFVATDDSGDAPTYTVASGSVPTGLTLSSSGLLSGSATASGTFTFTINATDVNGRTTTSSSISLSVTLGVQFNDLVVGTFNTGTTSHDSSGANYRLYTTRYDGMWINEWDYLGVQTPGINGKQPGNLSSPLGRSVPTTWANLITNSNRDGGTRAGERLGYALFVVGRDCPTSVTQIRVAAVGATGSSSLANFAAAAFNVSNGDAFRVVVGGASTTGGWHAATGCGGSGGEGDSGNNRNGGGASAFIACNINRSTPSTNRFLIAGGGGNVDFLRGVDSSSAQGDNLYSSTSGVSSDQTSARGGGPGAGGGSNQDTNGSNWNTGTGAGQNNGGYAAIYMGHGGGTGGNGQAPTVRSAGGAGGFVYAGIGIGGGGGMFGGGGGYNAGRGGWGNGGVPGTSRVNGQATTLSNGFSFSSTMSAINANSYGCPISVSSSRGTWTNGAVVVWW